jgi:multidrug efflux pump subunit AcrA (membrane-fusion protein)
LAADQASIDSLTAQLTAAKQNLAAATLTSPSAGTVAAVGFTPGTSSSGASITIIGSGVEGVQTSVPLGQVDSVKVGQPVTVAADGQQTPLHGTVASIGLLSTTSGSKTTFPVTVRLDANSPKIYDGSGADVVITTGTADSVTAVPTSAIHAGPGGTYTVTVANGSKQSTVRVTIGLAGADLTQVKSGLKAGQKVVLADLSQPLPGSASSASTTTTGRFGGGAGGFGGGGGAGRGGGGAPAGGG